MSSLNLINYFKDLHSTAIVVFVKQGKEMSKRMKNVYQNIKEMTNAEIRRMSEEEVLNYNNTLLKKISHVFVLDNFSGSSFDHLIDKKKAGDFKIFGVPLLEIMSEETVIVTSYWKIYNNSFQDLNICSSNLSGTEKGKIEHLVKSMNGRFTNELSSEVTHLITNSTKTIKYSDASNLDIPIYHTEWIYQIWNKCQKQEGTILKACSDQYDVFKLPPLFDLKIAITGMNNKDQRNELSDVIEENGGKFEEVFKSNETDILIMDKKDADNSKYKIAAKYKIPVLNVNWIHESIKAGYALSYNDFSFKRPKSFDSSSSSINDSTILSLDDSKKSEGDQEKKEETPKVINNVLTDKTNDQFLSTYTVEQAKKLGHIFDGYVFYLYNFSLEHYFKLGKLISGCGGIRIKELDTSITHILCFDKENLEDLHKRTAEKEFHGIMVDYKWLVECLKQGKLLSETDYHINANCSNSKKIVPPSPMSRKAINSLNVSTSTYVSKKENTKSNKFSKKELAIGTSSKMLDFSNHQDDDLIQTSIEASHRKKLKQAQSFTSSKKRSYEADYSYTMDENYKRRKTTDDEDCKSSFQVL